MRIILSVRRRGIRNVGGVLLIAAAMLGLLLLIVSQNQAPALVAEAQEAGQLPPGAPEPTPEAHTIQANTFKRDSIVISLDALEWMEYKYRMEKGATMVYSWVAPVPVKVEMHSEPEGGPRGYAEFFEKAEKSQGHGSYEAPFSGIHGWYFENLSEHPITITLNSSGFFGSAQEFRYQTPPKTYQLSDVAASPAQ
ncbi:MAG: hypothetical protein ACRD88_05940 [Terriglobia bacterium]